MAPFDPFQRADANTPLNPGDITTYQGALDEWTRVDAEDTAMHFLPPVWKLRVQKMLNRGMKAILRVPASEIPADATGVLTLRALARLVEELSGKYAYTHLNDISCCYRIGQVMDAHDREQVRGLLVMGRGHDNFTADPNNDYFRFNGAPANFASQPSMASMPPALPMQFLVNMPPYVGSEDFEKIWSEIIAQITPGNDIVTIDWPSFHALSGEQLGQLCERWTQEIGYMPSFYRGENCMAVYMSSEHVLTQLHEINNNDLRRHQVMLGAKAVGKEIVKSRTKLRRRGHGPPVVPRQNGQLILGNNQVLWNFQYQPPAPQIPVPAPTARAMVAAALRAPVARITRPPNSWIIYRADKHKEVQKDNPDASNNQISSIISAMWSSESVDVRKHYAMLAEIAKANHAIQHPNYVYKPRLASTIKRRRGFARATAVTRPIETFADSDEVMTQINDLHNMVDNSTQHLGGYDATVYQDEDYALGLVNPGRYDWE